jgi:hypothetical protein
VKQQTDSQDNKVRTQVRFIREKEKATTRAVKQTPETGDSVVYIEGVFIWSFLLGRGVGVRDGVAF